MRTVTCNFLQGVCVCVCGGGGGSSVGFQPAKCLPPLAPSILSPPPPEYSKPFYAYELCFLDKKDHPNLEQFLPYGENLVAPCSQVHNSFTTGVTRKHLIYLFGRPELGLPSQRPMLSYQKINPCQNIYEKNE